MKKTIPWKLIIAHLKGETTSDEEALFYDWISKIENKGLFDDIEQVWHEVKTESSQHNPDVAHYWELMDKRISKSKKKSRFSKHTIRYAAIAASIILLVSYIHYYFNGKSKINNQIYSYSAMSGKSKLILPDSSIVWLNTGSTINYAGTFPDNRLVNLRGEASFNVAKDKEHPFVVLASGVKIKVYGTYFNINSYEDAQNITVALNKGIVSIVLNENESFLRPGEIAVINRKDYSLTIAKADTEFETSWAKETISFEGKSLGYICKYLEKWYNVRIDVDANMAENQFYTFTIKDDPLEVILRIMSKINPIVYSFDEKNNVKIRQVKP